MKFAFQDICPWTTLHVVNRNNLKNNRIVGNRRSRECENVENTTIYHQRVVSCLYRTRVSAFTLCTLWAEV